MSTRLKTRLAALAVIVIAALNGGEPWGPF